MTLDLDFAAAFASTVRTSVVAATTGGLALGIAAPEVAHHEIGPIFVEAVVEATPTIEIPPGRGP